MTIVQEMCVSLRWHICSKRSPTFTTLVSECFSKIYLRRGKEKRQSRTLWRTVGLKIQIVNEKLEQSRPVTRLVAVLIRFDFLTKLWVATGNAALEQVFIRPLITRTSTCCTDGSLASIGSAC